MDDTYQVYINRVAPLTLPKTLKAQLKNIQKSAKFEEGKPVPFPVYTVITPTYSEDPVNREFYSQLQLAQEQLLQELPGNLLIAVPPESFHLTITDLIWDSEYLKSVEENPQFETKLRQSIANSFTQYSDSVEETISIQFQLLGLTIFPRAITVCLVPKEERDYKQIIHLRRLIYQNSDIIALGIEQQYNYLAHITLGYFNDIDPDLKEQQVIEILSKLNEQWIDTEPAKLIIEQAELSKFDDMTCYYRQADWPVLKF